MLTRVENVAILMFTCDLCGYTSDRTAHIAGHRGKDACLRRQARVTRADRDSNLARTLDRNLEPFVRYLKANIASCAASPNKATTFVPFARAHGCKPVGIYDMLKLLRSRIRSLGSVESMCEVEYQPSAQVYSDFGNSLTTRITCHKLRTD